MPHFDVAVLGAGIVGVSTAIELRRRGLDVALVDRRGPGEETSHGNAGIIQREGIHSAVFPRDPVSILRNALKLDTRSNYHFRDLPHVAPFLWRYFRASAPERMRRTADAKIPLMAHVVDRHRVLADEAGASDLIRPGGWISLLRSDKAIDAQREELEEIAAVGIAFDILTSGELSELEPNLDISGLTGAVHHKETWSCQDPGALTKAYAKRFEAMGGTIVLSEVSGVAKMARGFRVEGTEPVEAEQVVLTLGPWSKAILDGMGVRLPMGVKRGYHRHYAAKGNAVLSHPLIDEEKGFVMAPMTRGIRITSGVEFARIDAPKTPVQLDRILPDARELFPLADAVDDEAWMGARPCFPDMLPVIGQAPGITGLWLNFGHAHSGFMLGPVTGLLLAQMLAGETPLADPAPYSAARFMV